MIEGNYQFDQYAMHRVIWKSPERIGNERIDNVQRIKSQEKIGQTRKQTK